jgi:hypothetical protein
MAQQFERSVGDDLVGAHVRGGARAALNHVHDELVVELALQESHHKPPSRPSDSGVQGAQVGIGQGGGFLHAGQGADEMFVVPKWMPENGKFSVARRVCTP